jgi:nucleoside 2-deoxyribosyltransferase
VRRQPPRACYCGNFWYGGPFDDNDGGVAPERRHGAAWDFDPELIDRADLILAYIDRLDARTLVEMGWAVARGKPVCVGFTDDLSGKVYRNLWPARMMTARAYFGSPAMVWRDFEEDWIMTR